MSLFIFHMKTMKSGCHIFLTSNEARAWLILTITFNVADDMKHQLHSNEANYYHLNAESFKSLYALIIIIMYIYHVLINALSAHMIHINLNMIFYTHVEHSPTKTSYIKYYTKNKMHDKHTHKHKHTHTHTHTHTMTVTETGYW